MSKRMTKVLHLMLSHCNENSVKKFTIQRLNQLQVHMNQRAYLYNFSAFLTRLTEKFKFLNSSKAILQSNQNEEKQHIIEPLQISDSVKEEVQPITVSNRIIEEITEMYPELKQLSVQNVMNRYCILQKYGVNDLILKENPQLLLSNDQNLHETLGIISQFELDMEEGIEFQKLHSSELDLFLQTCKNENIKPVDFITAFCDLTKENKKDMCRALCKCRFLRIEPLSTVRKKVELLLDEGFKFSDIIADDLVLGYNIRTLKSKLSLIKKMNIQEKSVEMLRQSCNQLNRITVTDAKPINNDLSVVNYMAERIKCDKETIQYLVDKNPKLKSIKMEKIKEVLDMFSEFNIDLNLLVIRPQLFSKKADIMKKRLQDMAHMGLNESSKIHYLTKTGKEFEELKKKLRVSL